MTQQAARWSMPATVIRWVDGDTLHANVEVMPGTTAHVIVRVYGIDTPEVGQSNHDEAKAAAEAAAPAGALVSLGVRPSTDKYGRWLATVNNDSTVTDVGQMLLTKGLAVPYYGGTKGVPAT